jgi:plastocyanin
MSRLVLLLTLLSGSSAVFAGGVAADIGIDGFAYTTIEVGENVAFAASGFHPLRFDDNALTCGQNCNVVFSTPGEYRFYCNNHGGQGGVGMSGMITVIDSTITDRVYAHAFELIYE